MTRLFSVLILLTCGLCCGCVQYEHPLSPISEAKYDDLIFGSWHHHAVNADGKPEHLYLHIGPTEGSEGADALDQNFYVLGDERTEDEIRLKKMTRVVAVIIKPNLSVVQLSFLAFPSTVDGRHYMNAPLIMDGKVFSYGIVKYEIDGDKLKVWGEANDEAVKKLTKEGTIKESNNWDVYTENIEALRRLFAEKDALLFPSESASTFERIGAK